MQVLLLRTEKKYLTFASKMSKQKKFQIVIKKDLRNFVFVCQQFFKKILDMKINILEKYKIGALGSVESYA